MEDKGKHKALGIDIDSSVGCIYAEELLSYQRY
jgi:hypothetical protein